MQAARERAVRDKGGVPLDTGEKWLLTTKACHDLLKDREEALRFRLSGEKVAEERKMVRRGRKTSLETVSRTL